MPHQLELFDEAALLDRLITSTVSGRRPVTFLVGSPLTTPVQPGQVGVPGVAGMVEQVRLELGTASRTASMLTGNAYQDAFRALLATRGPEAVNRVVREAVLRAIVDSPAELLHSAAVGNELECRRACDALEKRLQAWSLSPGVEYLGRLAASFPHRLGQAVLTSNFDPLIEISIQRAGGACWRTTPQGDGSLKHSRGHGCHVVHVHGYWYDADTLHIDSQLQAERPQLRASLRRLFEDTTLVVVAYGGWDDVFSKALIDVVSDGGAFPEVIWTFHDSDEQAIFKDAAPLLARLRPGMERAGRVTLYCGVDCHTLFRKLWERLPAGLELDAWESRRSGREGAAGELHRTTEELAKYRGAELMPQLLRSLVSFTDQFVRAACTVALVARFSTDYAPRGISDGGQIDLLEQLSALSLRCGDQLVPWSAYELATPGAMADAIGFPAAPGVAVPLRLPGQRLRGHLFFLGQLPFTPAEISLLVEVARNVAIVINSDAERNQFKQTLGRFRHAALGPIQGIQSTALVFAELARESGANPDLLRSYRARLDAEIEVLRLWRENERFYLQERVDLRLSKAQLRPLVERCLERYYPALEERHIGHRLVWRPKGSLELELDESAFDVALSNVIDNSVKYSLAYREVVLEVRMLSERLSPSVCIMVEDVGHGIDAYRFHALEEREERLDPFRIIPGGGLGLLMAKAIVEAHGGTLSYQCEQVGSGESAGTTLFRMRNLIKLPLRPRSQP
jgi:signal transduction histidine kinase